MLKFHFTTIQCNLMHFPSHGRERRRKKEKEEERKRKKKKEEKVDDRQTNESLNSVIVAQFKGRVNRR